jgi:two-component system sensor histidine kinase KdpD
MRAMPMTVHPPAASPELARPMGGYVLAIAGAALAVLAAALAERWLGLSDLSLVFMLAVLVVASRTHTGPALLTAVLCFLAYNFFFIAPRYSLYIHAWQGVATVALFLAAALLAGRMAATLAMQVQALRVANRHANARQELAQRLAIAADETAVVDAAHAVFRHSLEADVWVRLDERSLHAAGTTPPDAEALRDVDALHAATALRESVEEHGWWFLPLRAPQASLGVIGLKRATHAPRLDDAQRQLARAMADDISQALLRTRLVADLEAERMANETERLRSALLSSVSHDLRTPLAAIIGAAGSLESYGDAMAAADRRSLLDTIREEGERLDRYIQNLLDMTRLGHGGLTLHRDWIGVDELIGSAIGRLQRYQPGTRFQVDVAPDAGLIWVHPALVEQALFNVIENAARFSPPGEAVVIEAGRLPDNRLRIDVRDRGPGIPEAERQRIFDMFYSVSRDDRSSDRGRQGTGLGLAICRGMIGAHGGDVEAMPNRDGVGTTLRISLPVIEPSQGAP